MSNSAALRNLTVYTPEHHSSGQKKSDNPSQPGRRSNTSTAHRRKKHTPILRRFRRFCKRLGPGRILIGLLILGAAFTLIHWAITRHTANETPEATAETFTAEAAETQGYIFKIGDGQAIDMQHLTSAWAAEAGFEKRYDLTDEERLEIASVITAEADGEPYAGKVAVAQCILQTCEDDGIRPDEALIKYSYTKRRPDPTEEALEAVEAVFDFGQVATSEPIKYFYAPSLVQSDWHESQVYVLTINNHKFFKEAEE
jgi:hypothetical protein